MDVTFVVAANDRTILSENLLASPCLRRGSCNTLIVQEGFASAATAYNDAINRAPTEIVVLAHQDVFLPESWSGDLDASLKMLAVTDPHWGVLGCWGVTQERAEKGYVYTPGEGVIGRPFQAPEHVQTLDELLLIIRRSSCLRFNAELPGFHFYGVDICMSAAVKGLKCYAISAFCVHNARQYLFFPRDFYRSYKLVKRLWKDHLPINTSCIRISRFDRDYWSRRAKEAYHKLTSHAPDRLPRLRNPQLVVDRLGQ